MSKKLLIIRGLPGSGKSTLATSISRGAITDKEHYKDFRNAPVFEADQFFTDQYGNYHFDAHYLQDAHNWCRAVMKKHFLDGGEAAIVSNTFGKKWAFSDYFFFALENGIEVEIITCISQFKSVHDVPEETMDNMRRSSLTATQVFNMMSEYINPPIKWTVRSYDGEKDEFAAV